MSSSNTNINTKDNFNEELPNNKAIYNAFEKGNLNENKIIIINNNTVSAPCLNHLINYIFLIYYQL